MTVHGYESVHGPQHSSCAGKIAYETRETAREALKRLSRRPRPKSNGGYVGLKPSIYKCSWCPAFHIGHVKPK